jgi:acetate kinase
MLVLVCNVGSTSLKYKLFSMPEIKVLAEAKMDRVGSRNASIYSYRNPVKNKEFKKTGVDIPSYRQGILLFLEDLTGKDCGAVGSVSEIEAIGFKTVIGKGYSGIHDIDGACMQGLLDYMNVAPVHNSAYLEAIREFKSILPDMPMVGVFEPYFHRTIPEEARVYGIPYEWTEKYGLRKYGYHGASHRYVSEASAAFGKNGRIISCHLGGSASICAIKDGKSMDNSFGFSLQSGVLHANRVGDMDPFIVVFLLKSGMSLDEIYDGLVYQGGLKGISGAGNDLRDIEKAELEGSARAKLAIDTYCYGIKSYIGSYYAVLGGLDMLVFTGGIGENSVRIRSQVCRGLGHMGILLDEEANARLKGEVGVISAADSPVKIAVIPANEELMLAKEVYAHIRK